MSVEIAILNQVAWKCFPEKVTLEQLGSRNTEKPNKLMIMMITIVTIIISTYIALSGYQYCPNTLPH